jgi:hypothetical protein
MDHDIFTALVPVILGKTGVDVMLPKFDRERAKVMAECKRVKEQLSSVLEVCSRHIFLNNG